MTKHTLPLDYLIEEAEKFVLVISSGGEEMKYALSSAKATVDRLKVLKSNQ